MAESFPLKIHLAIGTVVKRNLLLFVLLSTVLVGCTGNIKTQESAPVIEKSSDAVPPHVKEPERPVEVIAQPPSAPKVQVPPPTSNAVVSLITQARAQYQAKNYQATIAIAERGLRIDRRAPELYLLLAQSYLQLANTPLAKQFVQQGIRYAQTGTDVAQSLLKIRDALPH